MAANRYTFSNDLKAKDLCYSDEFFKLKSEKVIPSDSFSFDSYQAFKDINDFKTNNYSNLFLINKQRNSEWLVPQVKQKDELNGLATTLSWYAADVSNEAQQGSWLYFAKNYEMFDINVTTVESLVTYSRPVSNYSNYIFYLEFLDDNLCRISHTFGDLIFYLSAGDDLSIKFLREPKDDAEKFIYVLDRNMIRLYKRIVHTNYDDRGQPISTYTKLYLFGIERKDDKSAALKLYQNTSLDTGDVVCYVTNNLLEFDFYIDNSWVSYDRSRYISSIDPKKSAYNLTTQALIHHEYNKDQGFNFIPLKNTQTYKGNSIRGNNMTSSDQFYPDVDYRTYTTINSGLKQEKGNDNIILTFNFTDQEYEINDGQDFYFTIPQKSLKQTNGLQPLWPYKYININDTKFIKNGSFGSNVPFFADKVKKMQSWKTSIVDDNGKRLSPNNETYLCSWLYKRNPESTPIWLDRYYYPDMIHRQQALKGQTTYEQSFENILEKNYLKEPEPLSEDATEDQIEGYNQQVKEVKETRGKISRNTYFDKVSDLVIEPGNQYRYQRLSTEMINEVNQNLAPFEITTAINTAKKSVDIADEFAFDNEHYLKLDYKNWNKTNAINLNTDIYLTRKKRMGIQLFGSDYGSGFTIQNRKDLVPFHYYATGKVIYMLNNKFEIIHQFDLWSKYEDTILKFFLGDVFDDVIVVTGMWIYILSYDLRLKNRIDLTASDKNGKANGIKNLQSIGDTISETQLSQEYKYAAEMAAKRAEHAKVNHTLGVLTKKQWEEGVTIGCSECLAIKAMKEQHDAKNHEMPTKPERPVEPEQPSFTAVMPQEVPPAGEEPLRIYDGQPMLADGHWDFQRYFPPDFPHGDGYPDDIITDVEYNEIYPPPQELDIKDIDLQENPWVKLKWQQYLADFEAWGDAKDLYYNNWAAWALNYRSWLDDVQAYQAYIRALEQYYALKAKYEQDLIKYPQLVNKYYAALEQYQSYGDRFVAWQQTKNQGKLYWCTECGYVQPDDDEDQEAEEEQQVKEMITSTGVSLVNYPYGHTNIEVNFSSKIELEGQVEMPVGSTVLINDEEIVAEYELEMPRKLIAATYKFVDEDITISGQVLIPSNMSLALCESNPIIYKNNLYVPVNQRILKVIFCPDCQKDFETFDDSARQEYPAAARYLTSDEFILNYTKTSDSSDSNESIGVQGGFIEVENKIKHIFINQDGVIFGLNFDHYSVSPDGDTIYGLYAFERYLASGGWFWLFNQSMSKMQADVSSSKYAEFASPNSIDRIKFNERGEMCLLRNFKNLADNENPDNNKRMDIYDKTKQQIYTFELGAFDQILSLDAYNYIDEANQEKSVFTALLKARNGIYKITYDCDKKSASSAYLGLPSDIIERFTQTVNSNTLLRYRKYNALYFNLHVPSHYTYDYIATIKWDLQDIQDGWYNINVSIDLDKAQFVVRINDIIHETINEKTHSWFKPYVSSNGTTFSTTYYIGCIGKKYGTTLNKILKNSAYDPYVCKNAKLDNLRIHTKSLDYYEYQAMRMKGKAINKLLLTLPCGNRHGIDEIVRYFKYNSSPAISNKVKINITGTGLQTEGQFDMLRKEILAALESTKDCLVTVKDIEFV